MNSRDQIVLFKPQYSSKKKEEGKKSQMTSILMKLINRFKKEKKYF